MKLLVLGSSGQVGRELCRLPWPAGYALAGFDRGEVDITQREAVSAAIVREPPDIVINAAAYTAVDRAESEPEAAWAGNCTGAANLAAACAESGVPLIHISTDYVFDGTKSGPYREDDPVAPLGVYGQSKEAGDRAVRDTLASHVILRTAWVYSAHGHNFVKTMLRLADERPVLRVVADQTGSPTSAADIAAAIAAIVRQLATGNRRWGTYHFTGAGAVTWHGFAEAIFAEAAPWRGPPPPVAAIATADYPTPARRPANSRLDCTKIGGAFGIRPRPWREALAEVIREIYGAGRQAARVLPLIGLVCWMTFAGAAARGAGCDNGAIARHMVGEALLAANLVAVAEKAGMQPAQINAVLKDVAQRSGIDEFWITDSSGRAYITNTGIDFTFSPDPAKQPQASAFWPLLEGRQTVVVQEARKREIDDRVFKYVGVSGVDKPRIVQVGVSATNLPCN